MYMVAECDEREKEECMGDFLVSAIRRAASSEISHAVSRSVCKLSGSWWQLANQARTRTYAQRREGERRDDGVWIAGLSRLYAIIHWLWSQRLCLTYSNRLRGWRATIPL